MDVIVICSKCGAMAPWDAPDINNPWGTYHWHQPCPRCGANQWNAHDTDKDWRTGRPMAPSQND